MLSELNMVGNWFKKEPESSWQFDEFKFDDEAKQVFSSMGLEIEFLDYSARVKIKGNHSYIPNHYFLYAFKLNPLVILANQYIDTLEPAVTSLSRADDVGNFIESRNSSPSQIAAIDAYSLENFYDVFDVYDKSKRLGAKDIVNGFGKSTETVIRPYEDFVRSVILKALPVPDASSDMLSRIVYAFSKYPEAYKTLTAKYGAYVPHMFRATSGDDLLFMILSTLGWKDKLDSQLVNSADRIIDWGNIQNAFLMCPIPESGNTLYVEKPIHHSTSLGKYVHIKKGLLDTEESLKKVSSLVSLLWPNMTIHKDGSEYFFKSSGHIRTMGPNFEGATNKIFYGAPGTGKSHKIKYEESKEAEKITTVFHPDSQYNDFVGSLKPKMEKGSGGHSIVSYQFRPGPFTNALIKAKTHPDKHICLVIEEINRAPAAAVFGELFQLLDRDESGQSTYKIDASDPDMLAYINEQLRSVGALELMQLEIPSNLSLLATMNSSDQAVMPLDTAFKRRWSFEYLGIDFSHAEVPKTDISISTRNGAISITWPELAKIINDALVKCGVAEDRLIGPFFLNKKELKTSSSAKVALSSKLFVYLCDDVLRHLGYEKLFSNKYKTFNLLSSEFSKGSPVFNSSLELDIEEKGTKIE